MTAVKERTSLYSCEMIQDPVQIVKPSFFEKHDKVTNLWILLLKSILAWSATVLGNG